MKLKLLIAFLLFAFGSQAQTIHGHRLVIIGPITTTPDTTITPPPSDTSTVPPDTVITYALSFQMTVEEAATVSMGVYEGERLIRTLWSNQRYEIGVYNKTWDGLNDTGKVMPAGDYNIQELDNNVEFAFLGVLGNTSDDEPGPTSWHAHEVIQDMAVIGTTAYVTVNYNEKASSIHKFITTNPQRRYEILREGCETENLTTDGTNIYMTARDSWNRYKSLVYAIKNSDNTEVLFSSGVAYPTINGMAYKSVIDIDNQTPTVGARGNPPTVDPNVLLAEQSGIAVQRTGNLLFVARKLQNSVHVLNKNTGAFIRNITITSPGRMVTSNDSIWTITNGNVVKYKVNTDGTFSSPIVTITGLSNPLSVAVNGGRVYVNDGGTSQQVKSYNAGTGALLSTQGTAGGYLHNALASTNKFDFSSIIGANKTFTAFQPDGSYWVGDPGCNRILKYNSAGTYQTQIAYVIKNYSTHVDPNNTSRVTAGYLELEVDHTKPIKESWTLKRNWAGFFANNTDDQYSRLINFITLANGRTYAVAVREQVGTWKRQLIELTPADTVRYTGIDWDGTTYQQIYPDGTMRRVSRKALGESTKFYERQLIGFNSNNPAWNAEVIKATTPPQVNATPGYTGNTALLKAGERTTSGKYILYNVRSDPEDSLFHLGAVSAGGKTWDWLTSIATFKRYAGPMPRNGSFDLGNGVKNAGSIAMVLGNSIITGYIGEFWKASQANFYNYYWHNGLMVGCFGWAGKLDTSRGDAGNVLTPNLIPFPGDTTRMRILHGDESHGSGVGVWEIRRINTIRTSTHPFSTRPVVKPIGYNINSTLRRFDTLTITNGWYKSAKNDADWSVRSSVKVADRFESPDLAATFSKPAGTYYVSYTFPFDSVFTQPKMIGRVNFEGNVQNKNTSGLAKSYFMVLDNAGKTLARLETFSDNITASVRVNGQAILSYPVGGISQTNYFRDFSLEFSSDGISVIYGGSNTFGIPIYDPTANYHRVKEMRLMFTGGKDNKAIYLDQVKLL